MYEPLHCFKIIVLFLYFFVIEWLSGCVFQADMDIVSGGAQYTDRYPSGVAVTSQDECCQVCTGDPHCVIAVFDKVSGTYCWPMKSFTTLEPDATRTIVTPGESKVVQC